MISCTRLRLSSRRRHARSYLRVWGSGVGFRASQKSTILTQLTSGPRAGQIGHISHPNPASTKPSYSTGWNLQAAAAPPNDIARGAGHLSHTMTFSLKSSCKRRFPHKSVNLFFTITNIKNTLTDLCVNRLLQNALKNTLCEINIIPSSCLRAPKLDRDLQPCSG